MSKETVLAEWQSRIKAADRLVAQDFASLVLLYNPNMPDSPGARERLQAAAVLPFRQRSSLLNAVEVALFHALHQAAGSQYVVLAKVGLNELFFVARPNENVHYFNRLFRKSIDFLLCQADTLIPAAGVQQVRAGPDGLLRGGDKFVQDLFEAANLVLVTVPPADTYEIADLRETLDSAIRGRRTDAHAPVEASASDALPMCPVCGKMMVLRIQRAGRAKGRLYYGCIDNPTCPGRVAP